MEMQREEMNEAWDTMMTMQEEPEIFEQIEYEQPQTIYNIAQE